MSKINTSKEVEQWVPWAKVEKIYGAQEALRRLQRGTLAARRSKSDHHEWEFQRTIEIQEKATEFRGSRGMTDNKSGVKMPAFERYLSAVADGETEQKHGLDMDMLKDLGLNKGALKALKDQESEEDEEEKEDPKQSKGSKGPARLAVTDLKERKLERASERGADKGQKALEKLSEIADDEALGMAQQKAAQLRSHLIKLQADLVQAESLLDPKNKVSKIAIDVSAEFHKRADKLCNSLKQFGLTKSKKFDIKNLRRTLCQSLQLSAEVKGHKAEMKWAAEQQ